MNIILVTFFCLFIVSLSHPCGDFKPYPDSWVPKDFCAREWANDLDRPRHLEAVGNGDIIVSQREHLLVMWDDDKNGRSDPNERAILARAPGLNHGLALHGGYVYASSASTVYRWPYKVGDRKDLGPFEIVVKNIPAQGHVTRTPVLDKHGDLYVSIGSASNIDDSPIFARVVKFNHTKFPMDWKDGQLWANGLRNEVGLRFDKDGNLWGVMNGMDNIHRNDLGGDIHNTNPAEQVNLLRPPVNNHAEFYGYPYCWAEYEIPNKGKGKGTMWAADKFMRDGIHNDSWCQNPHNVRKPEFSLWPHTAPLDIYFYDGKSFPGQYQGDAFVALHGSWNSDIPVGYRVERIQFKDGVPVSSEPFFQHQPPRQRWPSNNDVRPTSVTVSDCGKKGQNSDCMFVCSDKTNNIILIDHNKVRGVE